MIVKGELDMTEAVAVAVQPRSKPHVGVALPLNRGYTAR
jgi:hypothetical protein